MRKEVSKRKLSRASFERRLETVKRKAKELTTLCDIEACVIFFESDGQLHTWPNDPARVNPIVNKYINASGQVYSSLSDESAKQRALADLKLKVEEVGKKIAEAKTENQKKQLKLLLDMRREQH